MENEMKAIILAAGVGSRLTEITSFKPKCLTRVNGKPLIQYLIESYINAGLNENDIYVLAGYKCEMVELFISETFPLVKVINNVDYSTTNNMYSLYLALQLKDFSSNHSVLINNGDCIYDKDLIKGLVASGHTDLIAVDVSKFEEESMKVRIKDGTITDISKEISEVDAFGVSIDLYLFSSESVKILKEIIHNYIDLQKQRNLWTEVAIQQMFSKAEIKAYDIQGKRWVEIDNMNDLRSADGLFTEYNVRNKKCFIVDLDGTVYLGRKPIQGTIDFIKNNLSKKDFFFLTNNTSKTPSDYVKQLSMYDINIQENQVITPFIPLIEYIKKEQLTDIFLIANKKASAYLSFMIPDIKFTSDYSACKTVILMYDTELNYEKVRIASLALHANDTKFIATHSDIVCPTEKGNIPDIGSIIALLKSATGREPEIVFGKPNIALLNEIKSSYSNDDIVIIGDRLYTDKKLADNAGIDFILVLSGESKRHEVELCDKFPADIVENLSAFI